MKIAILGATGGLGSGLAHFFHNRNYKVLAQGRHVERLERLKSSGLNCIAGELNNAQLAQAIVAFAPDVMINAAGKSGFSRGRPAYEKANIATVKNAIALAGIASNCRLVHFSSPAVSYQAQDCFCISEDKPFTAPVSAYAWSRQQAELELVLAHQLPVTIIRLRSAYGYGVPSPVETLRQKIIHRQFIPFIRGGAVKIDLIHLNDVVAAVEAVIQTPQKTQRMVLNVAGPEPISFGQTVDMIAEYENVKPKWLPLPKFAITVAGSFAEAANLIRFENLEPAMCRHIAGSLMYSQTLDLAKIKEYSGWVPQIGLQIALQKQVL